MGFADTLEVADQAVREVLGSSVTYSPSVGDPVTVDGVFDAVYVRVDVGQPGVSSQGPAVFLRLEDLPSEEVDPLAEITVDGTDYTIHEIQPDGLGGVLLQLHLA